ncbi:4245_t:CDS:2, partial [Scutellospora calospora]
SYKSSHRNIELELLRIVFINNYLDKVVSDILDNELSDSLKILKGRISDGSLAILDKFELGSEIFSSIFSAHYIKSSRIITRFAAENQTIDSYFGQVQFYFDYTINLLSDVGQDDGWGKRGNTDIHSGWD